MSNSALEEIRRQLDSLDDKIHDLLMKRAEVSARLGELARKAGVPTGGPAQEAALISRLLARHAGPMPRESVARIWRELCAAALLGQAAQKVAVTVPDTPQSLISWDMAKDYFGSVLPLHKVANPLAALSMVKEKDVAFAVLPWPEMDAAQPWWRFLVDENGDNAMRIVARLPLGEHKSDNGNPEHKSLVVARTAFTGGAEDRCFIGLQLEHRVSRGRIVDKAKALGMIALSLHSAQSAVPDYNDHLLEVTGFAGAADEGKLPQLLALLESDHGKAAFVGGYALPPLYDASEKLAPVTSINKKTA